MLFKMPWAEAYAENLLTQIFWGFLLKEFVSIWKYRVWTHLAVIIYSIKSSVPYYRLSVADLPVPVRKQGCFMNNAASEPAK